MNLFLNLLGILLLPFLLPVIIIGSILWSLKVLIEILIIEIQGVIKWLKHLRSE